MTRIGYRRKREGRTNYKKRLNLLKSRKPRLVVRRSAKHISVQVIEYAPSGDKVICGMNSKVLEKQGWTFSKRSLPAAYLTGRILCSKLKENKIQINELILDIGFHTPVKGSRIYAAVKGVIDGGYNVLVSGEIFPPEERLKGQHIVKYCKENKNASKYKDIDKFNQIFNQILTKAK